MKTIKNIIDELENSTIKGDDLRTAYLIESLKIKMIELENKLEKLENELK